MRPNNLIKIQMDELQINRIALEFYPVYQFYKRTLQAKFLYDFIQKRIPEFGIRKYLAKIMLYLSHSVGNVKLSSIRLFQQKKTGPQE